MKDCNPKYAPPAVTNQPYTPKIAGRSEFFKSFDVSLGVIVTIEPQDSRIRLSVWR
jgi:hypothetical protein